MDELIKAVVLTCRALREWLAKDANPMLPVAAVPPAVEAPVARKPRKTKAPEAPAPAAPTPRFGVGKAPTPPGPILDAVNQAMSLPTRRG